MTQRHMGFALGVVALTKLRLKPTSKSVRITRPAGVLPRRRFEAQLR